MSDDFESTATLLKDAEIISLDQFKELVRAWTKRPRMSDSYYSEPHVQLIEKWRKSGAITGYVYNRLWAALKPPSKESIKASKEKMKARFRRIDAEYSKRTPVVQGGLPGHGKGQ